MTGSCHKVGQGRIRTYPILPLSFHSGVLPQRSGRTFWSVLARCRNGWQKDSRSSDLNTHIKVKKRKQSDFGVFWICFFTWHGWRLIHECHQVVARFLFPLRLLDVGEINHTLRDVGFLGENSNKLRIRVLVVGPIKNAVILLLREPSESLFKRWQVCLFGVLTWETFGIGSPSVSPARIPSEERISKNRAKAGRSKKQEVNVKKSLAFDHFEVSCFLVHCSIEAAETVLQTREQVEVCTKTNHKLRYVTQVVGYNPKFLWQPRPAL